MHEYYIFKSTSFWTLAVTFITFGWTAKIWRKILSTPWALSSSIHSISLKLISPNWLIHFEQTAIPCLWPLSYFSKYTRRLFEGLFLGHLVPTSETDIGTMCFIESGGWHPRMRGLRFPLCPFLNILSSWYFDTGLTTGTSEFLYQIWQNGNGNPLIISFLKNFGSKFD